MNTLDGILENDLWQEKYRPKKLSDYLDYQKYADRVNSWLTPIKETHRTPRPFLVLYGEPGVGKTTLAHCILEEHGFSVIECNTSDSRTKTELNKILQTGQYVFEYTDKGMIRKPTGIIMDELDGIYGSELDGVSAIVNNTFLTPIDKKQKGYKDLDYHIRFPVILTSNSLKGEKYKSILDHAVMIKVGFPTIDALVALGMRICAAEDIPLTKVRLRQLASVYTTMDYRVLISNLYRIKLDMGKINKLDNLDEQTLKCSTSDKNESLKSMANTSLDKIILETRINTQLANFTNLPIHNMIGTIISHIPEHHKILHNLASINQNNTDNNDIKNNLDKKKDLNNQHKIQNNQVLLDELFDFKTNYEQTLQHIIDADIIVYYNDLLDNIPGIICAIGHEILKKNAKNDKTGNNNKSTQSKTKSSSKKESNARTTLLKLLTIMSRLCDNFRFCIPLEDAMNQERDSEQKHRLYRYISYILYAITNILNQLNIDSSCINLKPLVKDLPVVYHNNYNSFKQVAAMINNNLVLAKNDIKIENSSQPFLNQSAALITQDPELMYLSASVSKLPDGFNNSINSVINEKQYQSAIKKMKEQIIITS